jgi:uncharacterized YigZ family protein
MKEGPHTTSGLSSPLTHYRVPADDAQSELVIKNSVFIGNIGHAASVDAAQAFIACIRAKYPDANHHAWAYRLTVGPQGLIGSSDDGEPGGTAGRPMLAVLEGSGLVEIVVVGTRYWGGIKLGTGGLVRAYGGVAREALTKLPTSERVLHRLARVTVDYTLYGHLQYQLPKYGVKFMGESFAERVNLDIAIPFEHVIEVQALFQEMTNGQVRLDEHWIGERYEAVAAEKQLP